MTTKLEAEVQRLIREGKMPSFSEVVDAIRQVKGDPQFVVPVIHDSLKREKLKGGKKV